MRKTKTITEKRKKTKIYHTLICDNNNSLDTLRSDSTTSNISSTRNTKEKKHKKQTPNMKTYLNLKFQKLHSAFKQCVLLL